MKWLAANNLCIPFSNNMFPHHVTTCHTCHRRRAASDPSAKRIKFVRGLAESTGYADASWDLVVFSFIAHECPQQALRDFVKEARRIVQKGGVVCFVDLDPKCVTHAACLPAGSLSHLVSWWWLEGCCICTGCPHHDGSR
jgi:ubiquinone/menaquinone biosynthesis C-methylase UbiE